MVGAVGDVANMKRRKLWKTGEDGLCRSSSAIQTWLGPSSLLEERSGTLCCFLCVVSYPPKLKELPRYIDRYTCDHKKSVFKCSTLLKALYFQFPLQVPAECLEISLRAGAYQNFMYGCDPLILNKNNFLLTMALRAATVFQKLSTSLRHTKSLSFDMSVKATLMFRTLGIVNQYLGLPEKEGPCFPYALGMFYNLQTNI